MARQDLEAYFWYINSKELGPLVIDGKYVGGLYKIAIMDAHGIELTDSVGHSPDQYKKEADSLALALRAKGYEVTVGKLTDPVA